MPVLSLSVISRAVDQERKTLLVDPSGRVLILPTHLSSRTIWQGGNRLYSFHSSLFCASYDCVAGIGYRYSRVRSSHRWYYNLIPIEQLRKTHAAALESLRLM